MDFHGPKHVEEFFFLPWRDSPPVGQGLIIIGDLWSHSDTPHSVGLLWTSDQSDAQTSDNTQQSQQKTTHVPGDIRTCNPSKRADAEPRFRPLGQWDRQKSFSEIKSQPECIHLVFDSNNCIARAERDGTRAETRFSLSPKRTSPFKSLGASVQSTAGAEVCASALVMLDIPRSEVAWEYWLPTPFASFPFTSSPVRHRVPSGSERALSQWTV